MKTSGIRWFIAITVVVVSASAYFIVRDTRRDVLVESAPTPGFRGSERAVDATPFKSAEPTTTIGPTTIPGPAPTLPTTTAPTSAGPGTAPIAAQPGQAPASSQGLPDVGPATPATTPPKVPLPWVTDPGPSATPTCVAYYLAVRPGRETQNLFIDNPKTSIASVRRLLLRGFEQALDVLDRSATPAGPEADVEQSLRRRIAEMSSIASTVTTAEQGAAVYFPLQLPRRDGEAAGWPEILDHLERNCVEVYRSFGSTTESS